MQLPTLVIAITRKEISANLYTKRLIQPNLECC